MPARAFGVDAFTGLTGMVDSNDYYYQMRGLSSASIRLTQSLFEGGATQARIAMEKAILSNSQYLLEDAASSLVFDAISAHVNVLRQSRLVNLAQENIDDYREIIAMLRGRVDNGLATPGDISLVESRLSRVEGTLAEYKSELLAAKANFEMITGTPTPANLAPVALPVIHYKSAPQVVEACGRYNPRLKAERATIDQAAGQEKLAYAGNFPTIAFEGGPRWHVQNTPQDTRNHGWDALVTMRWNLFEGGATQAGVRQAAAQKRQARQNVQNVADTLKADILGTWAHFSAADERIASYRKSMETAMSARDVFYEQYLLGTKGLLDLLDADNEYFLSASQLTVAEADKVIATYRLLALGGDILKVMKVRLPEMNAKKK